MHHQDRHVQAYYPDMRDIAPRSRLMRELRERLVITEDKKRLLFYGLFVHQIVSLLLKWYFASLDSSAPLLSLNMQLCEKAVAQLTNEYAAFNEIEFVAPQNSTTLLPICDNPYVTTNNWQRINAAKIKNNYACKISQSAKLQNALKFEFSGKKNKRPASRTVSVFKHKNHR